MFNRWSGRGNGWLSIAERSMIRTLSWRRIEPSDSLCVFTNPCVDRGVRIFGGNGFVRNDPAEKQHRDAKVGKIYDGTSNIQRMTIAKQVLWR